MIRVIVALLLSFAFTSVVEAREIHRIQTDNGDTFFPLRMSMTLKCPGKVPRTVRKVTRVVGDDERQETWDELPDFFMEWDGDRPGYVLQSNEEAPEDREIIGYVDVSRSYRGSGCRHYIKVEALGGVTRSLLVSRIEFPITVHRKKKTSE